MPTPKNVYALGASRNIGYFASLKLLENGATVTFLLRKASCFDSDGKIQGFVKSGKAILVAGDALMKEDVKKGWEEALKHGPVDVLLFTVGGVPKFKLSGIVLDPPDLVTHAIHNALSTFPASCTPQPKVVAVSSAGVTNDGYKAIPIVLFPLYGFLLNAPHRDKRGAERILAHAAGLPWDSADGPGPGGELDSDAALEAIPKVTDVLVVRPLMFTDGVEKGEYRVADGPIRGYSISRRDVAHYIVKAVSSDQQEWEKNHKGKRVSLAY